MTVEEPLDEVLAERVRNYGERNKPLDFWKVPQPRFIDDPQVKAALAACPRPALAVVSTDGQFIRWLRNRLAYVLMGSLESPTRPE